MRKKLGQDEPKRRVLVLEKETLRKLGVTGGSRVHIPTGNVDDTSGCDSNGCDTTTCAL